MTISKVSNDDLLEEIRTLKTTVESLARQLQNIKLKEENTQEASPDRPKVKELQVGQEVRVLTKAKYGKHGDIATVIHIGKSFTKVKLKSSGRTTTRLHKNIEQV